MMSGSRFVLPLALMTALCQPVLAAQPLPRAQPSLSQPETYKAVEDDDTSSSPGDYFRGNPSAFANNFFLGAGLDYFDSFGLQARYAVRVLKNGFLPDLNNSFYVEGGLGMTFYGRHGTSDSVTGIDVLAAGRWDFQMDERFIFFGELGLGVNAVSNNQKNNVKGGGAFPVVGIGAIVNLTDDWALRGDLGYEFLGAGVVHRF